MSRSTIRNQLFLDQFQSPIATGTWVSAPINIDEHRRLSVTVGIESATGAAADVGGFTGTLLVQGTDELANANFQTGTPYAGVRTPGINGFTGARYWQTIPSGTFAVTNANNRFSLSFTDVGFAYVRLAFNQSYTGTTATGSLGGSGTWNVYVTAKNT